MPAKPGYIMHVVSHTHWDREWYQTFEEFRMRLVEMIDHLLDLLERDPDFTCFHLDGQTILLDDYLEIRPENRARLQSQIDSGRILIGPWYLLNDMFLVSGEAIVRNLLIGRAACGTWGRAMPVGYMPDQFGHVSQMPQILRQFGLDNAIIGRGISIHGKNTKMEFNWRAPDGSTVLTHFLAFWYNNAMSFPRSTKAAVAYVDELRDRMAPHVTTRHMLYMNGVDHLEAQADLSGILRRISGVLGRDRIVHDSLPAFVDALRKSKGKLGTVTGELREEVTHNLHNSTTSAHVELKQWNHRCQTALEATAEPLSVLGWLAGAPYERAFLTNAWKLLLQNHPHDSICGCSVEEVHLEMVPRFRRSLQTARFLSQRMLKHLAGRLDTSAVPDAEGAYGLVVVNTLPWARDEVTAVDIDFPAHMGVMDFTLHDEKGVEVPHQILHAEVTASLRTDPHELPETTHVKRFRVALPVRVGGMGSRLFYALPQRYRRHLYFRVSDRSLSYTPTELENEHVQLRVNPNGTLDVSDKRTGAVYPSCLLLEESGDAGNSYDYYRPVADAIVTSAGCAAEISTVHRGPETATARISLTMRVPAGLSADRWSRSSRAYADTLRDAEEVERDSTAREDIVEIPITSYVTIRRGSPRIDIRTIVDNRALDHRLRVLFPTGAVGAEVSRAESAFDVVQRPIAVPPDQPWFTTTHPMQGFVDVSDGEQGLAVLSRGIAEYEVVDDPERTVALTLLRGSVAVFGEPWAQGGNAAQVPGRHVFDYALLPHAGDWLAAGVARAAREYAADLQVIPTERHEGEAAPSGPRGLVLHVQPDSLAVTAVKLAEDRDSILLRMTNLSGKAVEATAKLGTKAEAAYACNLAEERETELTVTRGRTVKFTIPAHRIATLELVPAKR